MSAEDEIRAKSTSHLVVDLQRIAKNVSYMGPWARSIVLDEAAKRLTEYRERERSQQLDDAQRRHGR